MAQDFSVGPPWITRLDDLQAALPLWEFFAPRIRKQYRNLIAEMYAYSLSFATIGRPHILFDHFMVSYPEAPVDEQAWEWVGEDDDPCADEIPGHQRPTFLHYCELYQADQYYFYKRQVPGRSLLQCDTPLFREPRSSLLKERRAQRDDIKAVRHAWVLCAATRAINRALVHIKRRTCPAGFNESKVLDVPRPQRSPIDQALAAFWASDMRTS